MVDLQKVTLLLILSFFLFLCVGGDLLGGEPLPQLTVRTGLKQSVLATRGGERVVQRVNKGNRLPQSTVIVPQTPLFPSGKSLRPDGKGYCSDQCSCGCVNGEPCRCGGDSTVSASTVATARLALPTYYPAPTYAPVRSLRPANC